MRLALAAALAFAGARALAGPVGAGDPNAAAATGFPGAYLGSFSLALQADPRYGSRLLDALDEHLQAVGVMTGPREVADYLEQSAGGSDGPQSLRGELGREPLNTEKAAALLLAEALSRPRQFREVLDGLESLESGAGRHAAGLLRRARGAGDKRLIAALRAAGGRLRPGEPPRPYYDGGRLAFLFDDESNAGPDGVVLDAPAAAPAPAGPDVGPAGRPRSDQEPPERP
ncbi:MAG TPA: hypothetical protein VH309_03295 [Elusimicrobiota bacterium]|jgi:hypothetical protein|nr:hypothetical protein [Elusimicrobiota bacterium]